MNEEQKKTYLGWLRNAHAMELGLCTMLEKQASETADHPEIQTRIKQHLEETKRHAEIVEECLKRHDADTSGGKDILMQLSSAVNSALHSLPDDALIKNLMSSYAAEHFEISSYTVLLSAAEEFEDEATADALDKILDEEMDMANWLMQQMPDVVSEYLATLE